MTDRELLEMAYRAYRPGENYTRLLNDAGHDYWNPLTDDGDALRLAVKLELLVDTHGLHVRVGLPYGLGLATEPKGDDPYAATRRAIVRAAAAIAQDGGART